MDSKPLPARHGGDRVAEVLHAHGVRFVFTLCGGHISPILAAAKARGVRIVDTRHEATAVFAADAYARVTGRPGVAAVTAGPGLTNTITALKNAQLAQSPVVLIGGGAPTALQGRGALQDIDQRSLIAPHVKQVAQVKRVRDLGPAMNEALSVAASGVPGPVFVECPVDLLYDETLIRQWYADAAGKGTALGDRLLRWYLNRHASRMFAGAEAGGTPAVIHVEAPRAPEASIARAAEALARAERPLFVIGSQALLMADHARAIAEAVTQLGIPVYLSGMARGLLGSNHPLQMRHARRNALRESDCVLLAGVPCDFRLDYGRHVRRSATLIAANRSAKDARMNRRPTIAAIGDAGLTLEALAQRLGERAQRPDWIAQLRARDETREREIDAQAATAGEHVNPIAFFPRARPGGRPQRGHGRRRRRFRGDGVLHRPPARPADMAGPRRFRHAGRRCRLCARCAGRAAAGRGLADLGRWRQRLRTRGVRHVRAPRYSGHCRGRQRRQLGADRARTGQDAQRRCRYRAGAQRLPRGGAGIRRGWPGDQRTLGEVEPVLQQAREIARSGRPVLVNVWLDRTDFREGSISM